MIELASSTTFHEAIRIWTTCFGDTEQYARFLFDRLLTPEDVLFHRSENGRPDAMLCMKSFRLAGPGAETVGAYIFGVATLPESRNRGISSALLGESQRILARRGVTMAALVPAGPKLFEFYAKRGYETAFSVRRAVCPASDIPAKAVTPCVLQPARFEDLHDFRNRYFSDRKMFVDWHADWLRYVAAEARALGGGTFSFDDAENHGYVVCYPYKNLVIVKELAAPEQMFDAVLSALHEKYEASEYRIHLPEDFKPPSVSSGSASRAEPFAMVKWFDDAVRRNFDTNIERPSAGKPSYVAHVLDGPTLGAKLLDIDGITVR